MSTKLSTAFYYHRCQKVLPPHMYLVSVVVRLYLPIMSEWKKSFASTRRNSSSETGAPPFIFSLRL